jgi:hypothetical protein
LIKQYKDSLKDLLETYMREILDDKTKLIKKKLLMASARDGIKRQSSFYDNVIAWATIRHAKKLGLSTISQAELQQWKTRILQAFWNDSAGIFLDDLSAFAKKEKLFSADSFIVISTGFFDPANNEDMYRLKHMIRYVKKHKLDKPFPLHYSLIDQPNNLYRPVKHFAPNYMGTSIWSHWGMEYIKALLIVAKADPSLLIDAQKYMAAYKANIEHYGGYPEGYNVDGKILHTRLYRSVLHNGWVINYEQTKMLLKNY